MEIVTPVTVTPVTGVTGTVTVVPAAIGAAAHEGGEGAVVEGAGADR